MRSRLLQHANHSDVAQAKVLLAPLGDQFLAPVIPSPRAGKESALPRWLASQPQGGNALSLPPGLESLMPLITDALMNINTLAAITSQRLTLQISSVRYT